DILGVDPKPWFRFPFGDGADDPRVLDALGTMGYRNIHWDVDTEDWCEIRSPGDVHAAAIGAMRTGRRRAVVLFHTWSVPTASALPKIIADLRAAGASFATAAEVADGP